MGLFRAQPSCEQSQQQQQAAFQKASRKENALKWILLLRKFPAQNEMHLVQKNLTADQSFL